MKNKTPQQTTGCIANAETLSIKHLEMNFKKRTLYLLNCASVEPHRKLRWDSN